MDPSRGAELLEAPTSWRVVSSTLETLRELIEALSGGSLEQERYAREKNQMVRYCDALN
jgi:hypothetical protein